MKRHLYHESAVRDVEIRSPGHVEEASQKVLLALLLPRV
jgi:hypothetical protein